MKELLNFMEFLVLIKGIAAILVLTSINYELILAIATIVYFGIKTIKKLVNLKHDEKLNMEQKDMA